MPDYEPTGSPAAVHPRTTLPGSDRGGVTLSAGPAVSGADRIEITVVLRRRAELGPPEVGAVALTRHELAQGYGADPADIELVEAALASAGVEVLSVDAGSRRLRVTGTVAALSSLFGTSLHSPAAGAVDGQAAGSRSRSGSLSLPSDLAGVIVAVLGLDDRAQSRPRLRIAPAAALSHSYTPVELAQIYHLPDADGTGQTIAIIELGGGFGQSDLDAYFAGLHVTRPEVTAVGVDGAANAPGKDPSGADGEVLLDIEVAGAIAPAAKIIVYFAPNTDAGFLDAVSTAAHAQPTPTAISISWGQSEDAWTEQARSAMDAAFADAATMGVTVTAAAGDDGSDDRAGDGRSHADFPASSPHVLACGGTKLVASGGRVSSETVWNEGTGNGATGGGVSRAFPLPSWQHHAGVPLNADTGKAGRGLPDVAGDADPTTGYQVLVDGKAMVIGGTSAVAPLWAGIVARLAQLLHRPLGLLQPALYATASPGHPVAGLRDIVTGNNGAYSATAGWDACTGLGVPDGEALLQVLQAIPTKPGR